MSVESITKAKKKDELRTERLELRLTKTEKDKLKKLARKGRKTLTDMVVEWLESVK